MSFLIHVNIYSYTMQTIQICILPVKLSWKKKQRWKKWEHRDKSEWFLINRVSSGVKELSVRTMELLLFSSKVQAHYEWLTCFPCCKLDIHLPPACLSSSNFDETWSYKWGHHSTIYPMTTTYLNLTISSSFMICPNFHQDFLKIVTLSEVGYIWFLLALTSWYIKIVLFLNECLNTWAKLILHKVSKW